LKATALIAFITSSIVLERIFQEPITKWEVELLSSMQSSLGIRNENNEINNNFFFYFVGYLEEFDVLVLLMTHVMAVFYFAFDYIIAIKIMIQMFLCWFLMAFI
jgi:hypothetical protein